MKSTFPISSVRAQFPALRASGSLFDSPGGTQTPMRVADAVRDAMLTSVSQRGRNNYSDQAADRIVKNARASAAALMNVNPHEVFFGRSATQITFDIAAAIGRTLGPGDEVLVSRLDHDANIRPWITAARENGATLKWIDFDAQSGDLLLSHVQYAISPNTKIVALTAASNFFGTKPAIDSIAKAVHDVGALFYVDAVAYAPHHLVDLPAWNADFVVCSAYKFCGPHIGILASTKENLEALHPNKLRPATEQIPERFELGTLPYEMLAGVSATVDFLADLVPNAGSLRERLEFSYQALHEYEMELFGILLAGVELIDGVERIGSPQDAVPTAIFKVNGCTPAEAAVQLGEMDIALSGGHFYAIEAAEWANLENGALRVGLAPYTTIDDVEKLLAGLRVVAARGRE